MKTRVELSNRGNWAEIILCPEPSEKPPTLDFEVLDQLETHIETVEGDPHCRCLVLRSGSPKYFVVGANLEALKKITAQTIPTWIERGHRVFNRLESLPIPTIAVVEGYALGGGLELALACDLIYASLNGRFGLPEASLGFIPGWGGCGRLPERIGWAKAKELIFTGRVLEAQEAHSIGLVNYCGDAEALARYLQQTLESIQKNSPTSLGVVKKILNARIMENRPRDALEEATGSVLCLTQGDTIRRLADFFEKRK